METSIVRQRLLATLERVKRAATEKRARVDEAERELEPFLEHVAVPLCRQITQVLKADHHLFTVFTPARAVRIASERSGDDYVELSLDTEGEVPYVVGRTRRVRGGRVIETVRPIRECRVRDLSEEEVLTFLLEELERLLER